MLDPRQVAARLLGTIDWQSEVSGYCRCPGQAMHTSGNGKKDCRVNIDGAPTIHCFHASCAAVVAEANRRLRRELGGNEWAIALPGGQVLRSGEILERDGTVLTRGAMRRGGIDMGTTWKSSLPAEWSGRLGEASLPGHGGQPPNGRLGSCRTGASSLPGERMILESLRVQAERFRPELFEFFRWPMARILEESPLLVAERDAEDQFRTWLKLWPACSTVWVGDVYSSGRPEHGTHFRPVAEWYQIGPVMGNYTCGSSFRSGTFSRSNENLEGHRFLVIESDTLSKDEVGAIFAFLNRRLHFTLHAIIDTAGKSLHGWFDAPRDRVMEERLKAALVVFGCDPKVFTYSQPVRVPGAWRDGRLQRLIWLRN